MHTRYEMKKAHEEYLTACENKIDPKILVVHEAKFSKWCSDRLEAGYDDIRSVDRIGETFEVRFTDTSEVGVFNLRHGNWTWRIR